MVCKTCDISFTGRGAHDDRMVALEALACAFPFPRCGQRLTFLSLFLGCNPRGRTIRTSKTQSEKWGLFSGLFLPQQQFPNGRNAEGNRLTVCFSKAPLRAKLTYAAAAYVSPSRAPQLLCCRICRSPSSYRAGPSKTVSHNEKSWQKRDSSRRKSSSAAKFAVPCPRKSLATLKSKKKKKKNIKKTAKNLSEIPIAPSKVVDFQ